MPAPKRWTSFWPRLLEEKGVPAIIVRLFNTVGPRQTGRYGMVVPTFVRQALRNGAVTVYGDGSQTRCFGYVKDVVEALVRIASHPELAGEILNIGNDREVSIRGLAEIIRDRTGSRSEIVCLPYESVYGPGFEDMFRRVPSVEKLERLVGYRPSTPLETIIDAVARDMRMNGSEMG